MIHVDAQGPVVTVTIDRPERRNALDLAAVEDLLAAVTGVPGATRVLVLTGADGHFCAGADLQDVSHEAFQPRLADLLAALRSATFVTLAAADGAALGAGTQLAVACDLRVATPGASFGIPAAKLGLAVDAGTAQRVALLAGQGRPAPCCWRPRSSGARTPIASASSSASAPWPTPRRGPPRWRRWHR